MRYINALIVASLITIAASNAFALRKEPMLGEQIKQRLAEIEGLRAHEIEINVHTPAVYLSGFVSSQYDKQRVEEVVRSTNGVASVISKLEIKPPPPVEVEPLVKKRVFTDQELTQILENAFQNTYPSIAPRVKVSTRNGVVTLSGKLSAFTQVDKVISTALMIDGVKDIQSKLLVNNQPYPVRKF